MNTIPSRSHSFHLQSIWLEDWSKYLRMQGAICKPDIRLLTIPNFSGQESSRVRSSPLDGGQTLKDLAHPHTSQVSSLRQRGLSGVGRHDGLCPRRRPACSGSSAMRQEEPPRQSPTAAASQTVR